jgi:DNA-binding transcriptional LysR family regulator
VVERGYTILGLVAGRCGVALLPESLEAMPHPGVVFRRLVDPPRADLFVAWRSQNPNPSLAAFLKLIDKSSLDCPA